jgi:hypothetical protein
VKFINIPRLIIPEDLPQRMAQQQVRPLAICESCHYVLCSCGNCHSQICRQPCSYGSQTGASAEPNMDGKVWCEECGGMYLPHAHN